MYRTGLYTDCQEKRSGSNETMNMYELRFVSGAGRDAKSGWMAMFWLGFRGDVGRAGLVGIA